MNSTSGVAESALQPPVSRPAKGLASLGDELLAKVLTSHSKACAQGAKLCKTFRGLIIADKLSDQVSLLKDGVTVRTDIEIQSPQVCTSGANLYVKGTDGTFCNLNPATLEQQWVVWNGADTPGMCMTACGDLVITGHDNTDTHNHPHNCLLVWDTVTGNCNHVLQGHTNLITCVAVWGQYLLSGSWDNTVKVWRMDDAGSWPCVCTIKGPTHAVTAVLGWEGRVINGYLDGTVSVSDIATGKCEARFLADLHHVSDLAICGQTLLTAGSACTIGMWALRTWVLLREIRVREYVPDVDDCLCLAVHGSMLFCGGKREDNHGFVVVLDAETFKLLSTFQTHNPIPKVLYTGGSLFAVHQHGLVAVRDSIDTPRELAQ